MRFDVITLHKDDPTSWLIMPQVTKRILDFIYKYNTDNIPDLTVQMLQINFVSAYPRYLVLAGLKDGEVVAHLLATIDEVIDLNGQVRKRILTIIQYEIDKPYHLDPELAEQVWEQLQEWGRMWGCDSIQIFALDRKRAKLFTRYGFKEHRILMRRDL